MPQPLADALVAVPAGPGRQRYWDLLLLADDAEPQVRAYMQEGTLYALHDDAGEPVGIVLAIPITEGEVELKAVAIAEAWQGRGVGQRMLRLVLDALRERGDVRRVILGTGNSGIGQIAFYQKAGFRLWKIERDFFTPAKGYPEGLTENGILLRDMVWFDLDLDLDLDPA